MMPRAELLNADRARSTSSRPARPALLPHRAASRPAARSRRPSGAARSATPWRPRRCGRDRRRANPRPRADRAQIARTSGGLRACAGHRAGAAPVCPLRPPLASNPSLHTCCWHAHTPSTPPLLRTPLAPGRHRCRGQARAVRLCVHQPGFHPRAAQDRKRRARGLPGARRAGALFRHCDPVLRVPSACWAAVLGGWRVCSRGCRQVRAEHHMSRLIPDAPHEPLSLRSAARAADQLLRGVEHAHRVREGAPRGATRAPAPPRSAAALPPRSGCGCNARRECGSAHGKHQPRTPSSASIRSRHKRAGHRHFAVAGLPRLHPHRLLRCHQVRAQGAAAPRCCAAQHPPQSPQRSADASSLADWAASHRAPLPRSQEAHDAAVKHTFPMFSVPMTHNEFLAKL